VPSTENRGVLRILSGKIIDQLDMDFAGHQGVLPSRFMLSSPHSQRQPLTSTLFHFRTPSSPKTIGRGTSG
jgi:hypothetical protein